MEINSNINFNPIGFHKIAEKNFVQAGDKEVLRKSLDSPEDLVNISKETKTRSGNIPVIVTSKDGNVSDAKKSLKGVKAKVKDDLPIINGFTTEVSEKDLKSILANKPPEVSIFVDEKYQMIDPVIPKATQNVNESPTVLTDNAIQTLGVDKLWDKGLHGEGITIAVIDTGIYPHKDFGDRIIGFKDFVNGKKEPYDDQGHGTHVAGDAAGDGTASAGKYKGPAPSAKLVGIKSLDKHGAGRFSDIIKGIQWAVQKKDELGINVVNMSLGGPAFQSYKDDPISLAAQKALDAGLIMVIAAGNSGPKAGTVGSPGNNPNVMTVGAFNDKNTVDPTDDEIAPFSSRGPTKIDNLTKPDILSPGVNITAANAPGSALDLMPQIPHIGSDYITISGTSMATPVMAGIVSLIKQARPDLTPLEIKEVFTSTARRLPGLDANQQGSGIVQPQDALQKALDYKKE